MDADAAVPGYREAPPPPGLAPYVSCVWTNTIRPGDPEVVLPDGCADLLLEGVEAAGAPASSDGDGLVVAGPDTGPRLVPVAEVRTFAGLRFRPGAAAALLGVPLHAVADANVPVAELWGPARAGELVARVAAGEPPGLVLAGAVADRLAALDGAEADAAVRGTALARALRAEAGPGSVARVADALGLSERQLHRRSLALFGYGPKTLQRVLRFQDALRLARRHGGLARAASEAGYADQAHFARDVRALAGRTAGELLA